MIVCIAALFGVTSKIEFFRCLSIELIFFFSTNKNSYFIASMMLCRLEINYQDSNPNKKDERPFTLVEMYNNFISFIKISNCGFKPEIISFNVFMNTTREINPTEYSND